MQTDIEAINHLCNKVSKVSSHFLINKKGNIYNLVNLKNRSWHAGLSYWKNIKDINSYSIGIEMDYSGTDSNNNKFSNLQIKSLEKLLIYVKRKYKIKSNSILGHSDISPYRKKDPGEKFPWRAFSVKKIVFFPQKIKKSESQNIDNLLNKLSLNSRKEKALFMLSKIGYDVNLAKKSRFFYIKLIKAYQMHYGKSDLKGLLDLSTYEKIKCHYNDLLTI
jgi:N-acetylmuramoyl-L-alanine amidase